MGCGATSGSAATLAIDLFPLVDSTSHRQAKVSPMNLHRILRSLRRNLVPALLVGAVLGLLVGAASFHMAKPTYTATNTVLFQVQGLDKIQDPSDATTYASSLASTYSSMVTGPVIIKPAAEKLDMDPAVLAAGVTTTPPRQNLVMTITWIGADQTGAEQIVKVVGEQLATTVDTYTDKVGDQPRIKVAHQQPMTLVTPGTERSLVGSGIKGVAVLVLAALAWLAVRALLDDKVRDAGDIGDVTDHSVLGRVADPQGAAALARGIRFLDAGKPAVLSVTSATAAEHTSEIALNMARELARQEPGSVLLVDADLRGRGLSQSMSLTGPGLSEALSQQIDATQAISDHDGLAVLAAGGEAPNPAELLAGTRLDALLARLSEDYETIVVNAPGLLDHSDAALAAGATKGAVMVVGAGRTKQSQLKESLALLDATAVRPLGLVLSSVR